MTVVIVTHQQYAVLRAMLYDGASNREIAARLFVAEDTVKTHLRRLYDRLGVSDRLGVAIAVYSGAVDVIHSHGGCGGTRHLLEELQVLRSVRKEEECPRITSGSPRGTASRPPSPSST